MWGSRIIWHFSTSPYFSNRRVTSDSVNLGWMPVTNRLEPGLTAPSPSSLEPPSSLGGLWEPHVSNQINVMLHGKLGQGWGVIKLTRLCLWREMPTDDGRCPCRHASGEEMRCVGRARSEDRRLHQEK